MPPNAAFNVLVADQTFCHRVTASSLFGVNGTWLTPQAARGNPEGVVLVTANWNPGGLATCTTIIRWAFIIAEIGGPSSIRIWRRCRWGWRSTSGLLSVPDLIGRLGKAEGTGRRHRCCRWGRRSGGAVVVAVEGPEVQAGKTFQLAKLDRVCDVGQGEDLVWRYRCRRPSGSLRSGCMARRIGCAGPLPTERPRLPCHSVPLPLVMQLPPPGLP